MYDKYVSSKVRHRLSSLALPALTPFRISERDLVFPGHLWILGLVWCFQAMPS